MLFYGLQANMHTTICSTTYSVERNVRGIEEYLVAGTFVLDMELVNSRFVRKLSIEKMRSTALAPAQYVFNIVQDRGIVCRLSAKPPDNFFAKHSPPDRSRFSSDLFLSFSNLKFVELRRIAHHAGDDGLRKQLQRHKRVVRAIFVV